MIATYCRKNYENLRPMQKVSRKREMRRVRLRENKDNRLVRGRPIQDFKMGRSEEIEERNEWG